MLKKLLTLITLLCTVASVVALDINQASEAELDSIKGIGPGTSSKILAERKKAAFKDWNDFVTRVHGIGNKKAAQFASEGITVNGTGFQAPKATAKQ